MIESKLETRTFGELYDSLNEVMQYEIREKIKSLCLCSESAVRNWRKGHRRPQAIYQANIVKAFKSIGITTRPEFLFPR